MWGTATQSHEGPNGVRGSVGGPERRLYTGALRGGPAQTVRQMVYCVGQAEHPAGLHTGQSNLPNRRGELVLSLPKDDPYACRRSRIAGVVWEGRSRETPPYPDWTIEGP